MFWFVFVGENNAVYQRKLNEEAQSVLLKTECASQNEKFSLYAVYQGYNCTLNHIGKVNSQKTVRTNKFGTVIILYCLLILLPFRLPRCSGWLGASERGEEPMY